MENASKALLIAAGVLIGIMILSIAVYLAVTFGQTAAEVNEEIRVNQVAQFNSQFTKYDGAQVTIHDIITMANIARTNNEELFFRVIKENFTKRRKTITNSITNSIPKDKLMKILNELGIDSGVRGEDLSIEEFAKIVNMC